MRRLALILAVALLPAAAAGQQYQPWNNPDGSTPGAGNTARQTLIERLNSLVDEAEKSLADFQSRLQVALDDTRSHNGDDQTRARPTTPPRGVAPPAHTAVSDEALERVDAYLDSALAQGVRHVRIVHGKGTGALRQGVWHHLASHPIGAAFDFAPPERGGDGATEVELA